MFKGLNKNSNSRCIEGRKGEAEMIIKREKETERKRNREREREQEKKKKRKRQRKIEERDE